MKKWWEGIERRFKIGGAITSAAIVCAVIYVAYRWTEFCQLKPNEIGDFMAGVSAPLAFMWLVLGYMQQGDEIKETRVEIKRQADSIEANELHSRRGVFFTFSGLLVANMRFDARRLYVSFRSHVSKNSTLSIVAPDEIRERLLHDPDAFVRSLTTALKRYSRLHESFTSDEHSRAIAERFCLNFEGLITEAKLVSKDGDMISSVYDNGALGDLYGALCLMMGRSQKYARRPIIKSFDEIVV